MAKRYFGFRVDSTSTDKCNFFFEEIKQGRLRQGWGYDAGQNLLNQTVDKGASRNKSMLNVKCGNILLIPHIPSYHEVTVVEATDDWRMGYQFEINQKYGDYGHIFPVRYLYHFNRYNVYVDACIRSSLRNPSRFWQLNYECDDSVENLLNIAPQDLISASSYSERMKASLDDAYSEIESTLKEKVHNKFVNNFQAVEWEFALLEGLKLLYPEPYFYIEHVGGKSEKDHGSDLLIHIPSICSEIEYVIAIQIKDYKSSFNIRNVINQINKATFFENDNKKVIDKIIIVTKSTYKDISTEDEKIMEQHKDIRLIFSDDLATILSRIVLKYKTYNIN